MIRFIPLLLSFLFFFSITELHAGAAEKWEYEPVMKDMNIHVTGHKVDQYGAAVNDYEYNTKIDPKTAANRTKAGTVGMGRLLKTAGWGLLGSVALEALLEAVDWVIDPETQSIWRNKKSNNPEYGCFYTDSKGNPIDFVFYGIKPEACPLTALKAAADLNAQLYSPPRVYEFVSWTIPPVQGSDVNPQGEFKFTESGSQYYETFTLGITPKQNTSPAEKEYLTPEDLADYANHTHPDYADPELAPKLEPKYSPEIASDLWKPSNPWEKTNSPTVQEVNKKLDEAAPEPKTEPELTPNPETGAFKFPPFCEIAAPVCEFFKWVKEPPESPESIDVPEKEIDKQEIKKDLVTLNVRSCPADIRFDVQNSPFGIQVNKGVQMQPICDTIEPLKYVFQLITFVFCGFILLRV